MYIETMIRNIYGKAIATGEGTVAEVAETNKADLGGADLSRANLSWANLSWANLSGADLRGANLSGANLIGIPAPIVLLAQWGTLPDALTLDLMRYDAANHPKPERFSRWASGGPCPYAGLSIARAANFQERRGLIKADFLSLPVKSAWELACELSSVKGFQYW